MEKLNIQKFAAGAVTPVTGHFNDITEIVPTAGNTAGLYFTPVVGCERVVIIGYNSSDETAYDMTIVKPGTSKARYTSAEADEVEEIAAGSMGVVVVETAKFLDTDGYIYVKSEDATLKVSVFELL